MRKIYDEKNNSVWQCSLLNFRITTQFGKSVVSCCATGTVIAVFLLKVSFILLN